MDDNDDGRNEAVIMSDERDCIEQTQVDAKPKFSERYSDAYFSRDSVIYFIAAGDNPIKAVKIGVTARTTVRKRLTSIQSSNHERVRLLGVIEFVGGDKPGLRAELREAELHKHFKELVRAKPFTVGAEWFDWSPSLESFIRDYTDLPLDFLNAPGRVTHI